MLPRLLQTRLTGALSAMPVVALLGPRQVGKTTLALEIAKTFKKETAYLDLELDTDKAKLQDPEGYLRRFENRLLIIDEVQRQPDLFRILRGLVDIRKRAGEKAGQFLLLGSASRDLIQQTSETLAGRIRFLELHPFSALEIQRVDPERFTLEKIWLRGGFPDSFLAGSDDDSWDWRTDFISSYVERDIPLMGPQISPTRMRDLWSMLAHYHTQQINLSRLGESLGVNYKTVKNYIDTLTDFYMLRQIQPWSGNTRKRLVKTPRIYLRDSGLMHRLLNISDYETLLGHPAVGPSWEGFVIENIIVYLSDKWRYSYYRTSARAEVDLVLEGPNRRTWAVEIKRSTAPRVTKGFYLACEDIKATKQFVIYPGKDRFPLDRGIEAMGLIEFLQMINE
jgi:hypothetical protein